VGDTRAKVLADLVMGLPLAEEGLEAGGTDRVEGEWTGDIGRRHLIVGQKSLEVAGDALVPGRDVGYEGFEGPALGWDIAVGVVAVGAGVLIARGRANRSPAPTVGRTARGLGAAHGPGPAGRAVGADGGAAGGAPILSFVHNACRAVVRVFLKMIIVPGWCVVNKGGLGISSGEWAAIMG